MCRIKYVREFSIFFLCRIVSILVRVCVWLLAFYPYHWITNARLMTYFPRNADRLKYSGLSFTIKCKYVSLGVHSNMIKCLKWNEKWTYPTIIIFFRIHFLRIREREKEKKNMTKNTQIQKKWIEKERRNVNLKSLHEYAIQMLCSVSQTLNERRKIPLFPRLNTQNIIGLQHMLYCYCFFFSFVNGIQHSDISCQKWYYSFFHILSFRARENFTKYDWFVFTFSNLTTWWWWTWKMAPKNNIVTFSFHSIDSFLWWWTNERKSVAKTIYEFSTNETMYEQRLHSLPSCIQKRSSAFDPSSLLHEFTHACTNYSNVGGSYIRPHFWITFWWMVYALPGLDHFK